jgi:hypothetical protein
VHRQLGHRRHADNDRAGSSRTPYDGCVSRGDAVAIDARAFGPWQSGDGDVAFDAYRKRVQGASLRVATKLDMQMREGAVFVVKLRQATG